MAAREAELLPIPYFHVTFTLPRELRPIAIQNKRVVYGILFRAAAQTLLQLGADPKHLGAEIGVLAVLHTWGSKIDFHPHLHCVVTGGGISRDGSHWVHCKRAGRKRKQFFIAQGIVKRVFRGKFIDFLKRAYRSGELEFHGKIASLAKSRAFEQRLGESVRKDGVVDIRRPFHSPQIVLKYLARYTHRVAISNNRLVAAEDGYVHFRYKDYADSGRPKVLALEATEFIRRFLLHVLPKGFMRIRHYGILANRFRHEKLALSRRLLGVREAHDESLQQASPEPQELPVTKPTELCPLCSTGQMIVIHEFHRTPKPHCAFASSRAPPSRRTA